MKHAILMMGLPLAGKSSWINKNLPGGFTVISADAIKEAHPDYNPLRAEDLHEYSVAQAEQQLTEKIALGDDVLLDGGSINNSYTVRIIERLKAHGYHIRLVHVKTPLLVCLDRNNRRERKVPAEEIAKKSAKENAQFHRLSALVDEVEVVNYFTNEHIFIDMDGVLAAQSTLPKFKGELDFVNSQIFTHQAPVAPIIEKCRELHEAGRTLYILSAAPTSISLEEKHEWLDRHVAFIPKERRFFVNQGRHKAEMLEGLRNKFKLDKQQVTLVDDYHNTLYDVLERKMNPIHPSEFLASF
jgi:predicted kinase